jgi:transposase-like protein
MIPKWKNISAIFQNEDKAINFLFDNNIIQHIEKCPICNSSTSRSNKIFICQRKGCRKAISIFNNSFFSGCKLPINEVLFIAYNWINRTKRNNLVNITTHSRPTITTYYNYFRDLIAFTIDQMDTKIGGKDIIVEIDESKFGKRKYNRGHKVEGVWVVGGIERTPEKRAFAVTVPNRNEITLLDIISQHVYPGSIIYTDMWKGYLNIIYRNDMKHYTVNHSKNFVDPTTGVHTNTVEGMWNGIKMNIAPRNRTKSDMPRLLQEYIWRKENSQDLWNGFIHALQLYSQYQIHNH